MESKKMLEDTSSPQSVLTLNVIFTKLSSNQKLLTSPPTILSPKKLFHRRGPLERLHRQNQRQRKTEDEEEDQSAAEDEEAKEAHAIRPKTLNFSRRKNSSVCPLPTLSESKQIVKEYTDVSSSPSSPPNSNSSRSRLPKRKTLAERGQEAMDKAQDAWERGDDEEAEARWVKGNLLFRTEMNRLKGLARNVKQHHPKTVASISRRLHEDYLQVSRQNALLLERQAQHSFYQNNITQAMAHTQKALQLYQKEIKMLKHKNRETADVEILEQEVLQRLQRLQKAEDGSSTLADLSLELETMRHTLESCTDPSERPSLIEEILYQARDLVVAHEDVLGNHPETADASSLWAQLQIQHHQLAIEPLEKAAKVMKECFGASHPRLGPKLAQLGRAYQQAGRWDDTLKVLEEALVPLRNDCNISTEDNSKLGRLLNALNDVAVLRIRDRCCNGETVELLQEALEICSEDQKVQIYRNLSEAHLHLKDHTAATKALYKALELQDNGPPHVAETLRRLGKVYMDQHDHFAALEVFQKALDIERELENEDSLAQTLYSVAEVKAALGHRNQAKTLWLESLELRHKAGHSVHCAMCLQQLGSLTDNEQEATLNFSRALGYARVLPPNHPILLLIRDKLSQLSTPDALECQADWAVSENKINEAIALLSRVMELRRKNLKARQPGARAETAHTLVKFGDLLAPKDPNSARRAYTDARKLLAKSPNDQLMQRLEIGLARIGNAEELR